MNSCCDNFRACAHMIEHNTVACRLPWATQKKKHGRLKSYFFSTLHETAQFLPIASSEGENARNRREARRRRELFWWFDIVFQAKTATRALATRDK